MFAPCCGLNLSATSRLGADGAQPAPGEKLSGRVIGQEASTAGEAGLGRRWGSCVPTAGRGGGLSCQVQQRVVGSGHLDAPPTLSKTGAKGVCGLVTKVA